MNIKRLSEYCFKLKSKNCVSIAPVDIRTSQQIVTILVPEFVSIVENLALMHSWKPEHCLRFSGFVNYGNKCNCTLCILLAQVNYIIR